MKVQQKQWVSEGGWSDIGVNTEPLHPQLVLVFGGRVELENADRYKEIKDWYPDAHVLLGSSAGEIIDTQVRDNTLSLTAIEFEKTELSFAEVQINDAAESEAKGEELSQLIKKENLVHVMVFSDGLKVNGTALVDGLLKDLSDTVAVTGGLVGDGADFKKTVLGLDTVPTEGNIVVVGFHGDSLKVGHGSLGGWETFGPERLITKSENNVLYELDGKPALALYKEYLGEEAANLPGSGLLFPLNLKVGEGSNETEVVRTLLAVDEEANSMTFAGDMPVGAGATLMKANFDRLVEGAKGAAEMTHESIGQGDAELAILISCIGRKLVLKERVEEETETVREVIGRGAAMTGFYSYGEISPVAAKEKQCRLHNQTMTITTFKEE